MFKNLLNKNTVHSKSKLPSTKFSTEYPETTRLKTRMRILGSKTRFAFWQRKGVPNFEIYIISRAHTPAQQI